MEEAEDAHTPFDETGLDADNIAAEAMLDEDDNDATTCTQLVIPPDLVHEQLWGFPGVWPHGDDMSLKADGTTRFGTLNSGLSHLGNPAHAAAVTGQLADLMRVFAVDVLCLQEVHRWDDDTIVRGIQAAFEQRQLRFHYQGAAEEDCGKLHRTYAGVAIITAFTHQTGPALVRRERQAIGRIIGHAIPRTGPVALGRGAWIAVASVYGHALGTHPPHRTTAKLHADIAAQTLEVRDLQAFMEDVAEVQVICTDANLLYDRNEDAGPNSSLVARQDGFLNYCLKEKDYADALRLRSAPGERISTYFAPVAGVATGPAQQPDPVGQPQSANAHQVNNEPVALHEASGTYLDRILVRGAATVRAGLVLPRHLYPMINVDHALVLADIRCPTMAPIDISTKPAATLARKSRVAVQLAARHSRAGTLEGLHQRIVDAVTPAIQIKAKVLTIAAQRLLAPSQRIVDRGSFSHQLHQVQELITTFTERIYAPIVEALQPPPAATTPKPGRNLSAAEYAPVQVLRAAVRARPTEHIQRTGPVNLRRDAPHPIGVQELAACVEDSWEAACRKLGHDPADPRFLSSDTMYALRLLRILPVTVDSATRLNACQKQVQVACEKLIAHRRDSFDTVWADQLAECFHNHDFATIHRMCAPSRSHQPPAISATTVGGEQARTRGELLEAARQAWNTLYGVNKWTPPPFIARQDNAGHSGQPSASFVPLTEEQLQQLGPGLQNAYKAFTLIRDQAPSVDWDRVVLPLSEDDFMLMERSRCGQAPGQSGLKLGLLQHFPLELRLPLRATLQVMWQKQLLPAQQLEVRLVLLPKPNGSERGISLMEEVIKALEQVLAHRMLRLLHPGKTIDDVLSPINRAYKPGMSCADILHSHALTLQDACTHHRPLVCLMTDLAKFYDTVQPDVLEVILQLRRTPPQVTSLVRAMYHHSRLRVACAFGDSAPIDRNIGIHQGSAFSCLACLLVLEPFHRLQEFHSEEDAYCIPAGLGMPLRIVALPSAYCDDHNDYAATVAGMQRRIARTAPVLAACGIGIDSKVTCIAFNLPPTAEGAPAADRLLLPSYSRVDGAVHDITITVRHGAEHEYKLLGVTFRGAYPAAPKPAKFWTTVQIVLRLGWNKVPLVIICRIIQANVISRYAGHAVLLSGVDERLLSKLDTVIANVARNRVGLPITTPRSTVFAPRAQGGLQVPSMTVEMAAATARELCVLLAGSASSSALARRSVAEAIASPNHGGGGEGQDRSPTHRMVSMGICRLANHGFQVRCSAEPAVNRILDALQREAGHFEPACIPFMTARADERKSAALGHLHFSTLSDVSRQVRRFLANAAPHPPAAGRAYSPFALAEPLGNVIPEAALSAALEQAIAEARHDTTTLASCMGLPDALWEVRSLTCAAGDHPPVAPAAAFMAAIDTAPNAEHLAPVPVREGGSPFTPTATDGGDNTCAWVMAHVLPPIGRRGVEGTAEAYGTFRHPPVPPIILHRRGWQVPQYIGTTRVCSYDTETLAAMHDLLVRCYLHPIGPTHIDNQSVQLLVGTQHPPYSARERLQAGRGYLMAPLMALQARLRDRHNALPEETRDYMAGHVQEQRAQWSYDPGEPNRPTSKGLREGPGKDSYLIVKVKSHTPLEEHEGRFNHVSAVAHLLNDEADRRATEATAESLPADILYNPCPEAFELVHRGRSVTADPARYIRQHGAATATAHVGNLRDRPRLGLPAACMAYIHPGARDLTRIGTAASAHAADGLADRAHRTAFKVHFAMTSWAGSIRYGATSADNTAAAYAALYQHLLPQYNGGAGDPAVSMLCPFCLSAGIPIHGGSSHYRTLHPARCCTNEAIRGALTMVYAATEAALCALAPAPAWVAHSPNCNPDATETAAQQPVAVAQALATQFPVLWALQWVVDIAPEHSPTPSVEQLSGEHSIARRLVLGLGMRCGTTPAAITLPPREPGGQPRPLTADEVRQLESAKLEALAHLDLTIHNSCAEAVTALAAQLNAAAPLTAPHQALTPTNVAAPVPEPRHPCSAPGCLAHNAPAWPRYCADHRTALHVRMLTARVANMHILQQRDYFGQPVQNLLAQRLLWHLRGLDWLRAAVVTPAQLSLTSANGPITDPACRNYCWLRAVTLAKLDSYTTLVLERLAIPYIPRPTTDPGPNPAPRWAGSAVTKWCVCGPLGQGAPARIHTCTRCNRLRTHTPPPTPPGCLRCTLPHTPGSTAAQCSLCSSVLHTPDPERPACAYDPRILHVCLPSQQWVCPMCVQAICQLQARSLLPLDTPRAPVTPPAPPRADDPPPLPPHATSPPHATAVPAMRHGRKRHRGHMSRGAASRERHATNGRRRGTQATTETQEETAQAPGQESIDGLD